MQSLWLPAIQAQLALNKKNPTSALTNLQAASSIELEQIQFVINISCSAEETYLAAGRRCALGDCQPEHADQNGHGICAPVDLKTRIQIPACRPALVSPQPP